MENAFLFGEICSFCASNIISGDISVQLALKNQHHCKKFLKKQSDFTNMERPVITILNFTLMFSVML
jgi:hypothetical protein